MLSFKAVMAVLNTVLFWFAIFWVGRLAFELVFNRGGVPNMRSLHGIRRKMIARLREDMAAQTAGPYTIIDLGSGNGHLTSHIARALPQAHVMGLDTSFTGYHLSRLRQRLFGLTNLEYRRTSFFDYDISAAQAIVMYLSPNMLSRLRGKLRAELKPGALIISNTFALAGDWEPLETIEFKGLYQKALLIYRR